MTTAFEDTGPKLSPGDFSKIEARMSVKIPDDLRQLYLSSNGGSPLKALVFTDDWINKVHEFLHFTCEDTGGIEETYLDLVEFQNIFQIPCIPFAVDEGGDYYLYSLAANSYGKIYFFDSNRLFDEDSDGLMTEVGESLHDFLARLH